MQHKLKVKYTRRKSEEYLLIVDDPSQTTDQGNKPQKDVDLKSTY